MSRYDHDYSEERGVLCLRVTMGVNLCVSNLVTPILNLEVAWNNTFVTMGKNDEVKGMGISVF